jgi:hypothetical protein
MNSAFIKRQAVAFSKRLIKEVQDDEPRIKRLYQLAYGRNPQAAEMKSIHVFLTRYREAARRSKIKAPQLDTQAFTALCRVVLTANEFFFID